jgi:hypothetical protein
MKPDLSGEKAASNRLSHGRVMNHLNLTSAIYITIYSTGIYFVIGINIHTAKCGCQWKVLLLLVNFTSAS